MYLGDAVYASFDGFQIRLRTSAYPFAEDAGFAGTDRQGWEEGSSASLGAAPNQLKLYAVAHAFAAAVVGANRMRARGASIGRAGNQRAKDDHSRN